jgi:hypothetical protein
MFGLLSKKTQRQKNASKLQWGLIGDVVDYENYKKNIKSIRQTTEFILNNTSIIAIKVYERARPTDISEEDRKMFSLVVDIKKKLFEIADKTSDSQALNGLLDEACHRFADLEQFETFSGDYITTFSDFFVSNMLVLMMSQKGEDELLIYSDGMAFGAGIFPKSIYDK